MNDQNEAREALKGHTRISKDGGWGDTCTCGGWRFTEGIQGHELSTWEHHVADVILAAGYRPPPPAPSDDDRAEWAVVLDAATNAFGSGFWATKERDHMVEAIVTHLAARRSPVPADTPIEGARKPDSRVQQLRGLIEILVRIVEENDGRIQVSEATREFANRTGLSVSEVPYIVNSAVADRRIAFDLRSGMIERLAARPTPPEDVAAGDLKRGIEHLEHGLAATVFAGSVSRVLAALAARTLPETEETR